MTETREKLVVIRGTRADLIGIECHMTETREKLVEYNNRSHSIPTPYLLSTHFLSLFSTPLLSLSLFFSLSFAPIFLSPIFLSRSLVFSIYLTLSLSPSLSLSLSLSFSLSRREKVSERDCYECERGRYYLLFISPPFLVFLIFFFLAPFNLLVFCSLLSYSLVYLLLRLLPSFFSSTGFLISLAP